MKYGFGVDLGGTSVKIALFDTEGTRLDFWEIPTDCSDHGSRILRDIAESILGYLADHSIDRSRILGAGIGVPGAVLPTGEVNQCENLGWGRFDVTTAFSQLLGFPVKAANDANAAALGEAWKGSGADADSMVMVTLGTGVGGGIILNGQILNGAHGGSGEIGHMVLNRNETIPCACGKYGCVEQYCSATGIVRIAREALAASDDVSALRGKAHLDCRDIFDCARAGDRMAQKILDQVYRYLGEFMANVCMVIDPEVVVLGGGVSKAGPMLLDGIRPYYLKNVFHASRPVEFRLAALGNAAGTYGAFRLLLDQQKESRLRQ